jgi:enoyl-CoA hydratase/carnithine racemase
MAEQAISVERDGGVAVVTLQRPDSMNALNKDLLEQLHEAIDQLNADLSCRCVVLTGAGDGFCAGLDLNDGHFAWPGTEHMSEVPRQLVLQEKVVSLIEKIHDAPKPYIAAVNGAAVGGGFALALACDIRIASDQGSFGVVFIKLGASNTDLGISYLLPRIVGAGRSAELLLTGRIFGAEEASQIGLVYDVVDSGKLLDRAKAKAQEIAENGAFQLWMTKETMWASLDAPSLRHAIDMENRTQIMCSMAGDVEQAFLAFRKKQKPTWRAM